MAEEKKIQRCGLCDEPTDRCDGDALLSIDDEPLCETCFVEEQLK